MQFEEKKTLTPATLDHFTKLLDTFRDKEEYEQFKAVITNSFRTYNDLTDAEKAGLQTYGAWGGGQQTLTFSYHTAMHRSTMEKIAAVGVGGDTHIFMQVKMRKQKKKLATDYMGLNDCLDNCSKIAMRYALEETQGVGSRYYTFFGHAVARLVFLGGQIEMIVDDHKQGYLAVLVTKNGYSYRVTYNIRKINQLAFKRREDYMAKPPILTTEVAAPDETFALPA